MLECSLIHGEPTPYSPAGKQLPILIPADSAPYCIPKSSWDTHSFTQPPFTFPNTCLVQADFTIWYLTHCTSRPVPPRIHCPEAEQTSLRPIQNILCPVELSPSQSHGLVTDHLAAWCSATLLPSLLGIARLLWPQTGFPTFQWSCGTQ